MGKFLLSLLIICIQIPNIWGQKLSKMISFERDSSVFEAFHKNFTVKPFIAYRNFKFEYTRLDKTSRTWKPNVNLLTGIGGTYKNLQLNMFFKIPGTQKDEKSYGKTKYRDVNVYYYTDILNGLIYYKEFEGMYSQINDNFRYIIPTGSFKTYGLESFWVFNRKNISTHLPFKQTEHIKKFKNSFLLKAEYQHIEFDNMLVQDFPPLNPNFKEKYNIARFMPGYTLQYSIQNWYVCPYLFSGVGYNFGNEKVNLKTNFKLGFGYNGKNWMTGIIYELDKEFKIQKGESLMCEYMYLKFHVGIRL